MITDEQTAPLNEGQACTQCYMQALYQMLLMLIACFVCEKSTTQSHVSMQYIYSDRTRKTRHLVPTRRDQAEINAYLT